MSYSVAVIGDGGLALTDTNYALAREIGARLIDGGLVVVTGGLGGVMEAASRGAVESPRWSAGRLVSVLPGCDPADANAWAKRDVVICTGLDHTRNSIVAQSDAVIAVGGGAGTLSEMAFAWIYRRLVVAMRVRGWSGRLADQRVDDRVRYADMEDDRVFGADTADEAVATVLERIGRYTKRHHGIRRRA